MAPDLSQIRVTTAFSNGSSVAIVGSAGSGKSFLLRKIISLARETCDPSTVAVCALTNYAALEIDGVTFHSLVGAPPSWKFSNEKLLEIVQKDQERAEVLRNISVIIIEEAFLLSSNMIDALDHVLRHLSPPEKCSKPFGGRQLVIAGDPFQLEPVGVENGCDHPFFSSQTWLHIFSGYGTGILAFLSRNHRQKNDEAFFSILNRLRVGHQITSDIAVLNRTSVSTEKPPKTHTILCLHKKTAHNVNASFLKNLPGEVHELLARDSYLRRADPIVQAQIRSLAPHSLEIKVGCDVLLTRRHGVLVPGSRGVVVALHLNACGEISSLQVDFTNTGQGDSKLSVCISRVRYRAHSPSAEPVAFREQFPLLPAYAVMVHRCQGLQIPLVAMDFRTVGSWKPNGMVYVALSRCRSLSSLWVKGLHMSHVVVSFRSKGFMTHSLKLSSVFPTRVIGRSVLQTYRKSEEIVQGISKGKDESPSRQEHENISFSRKRKVTLQQGLPRKVLRTIENQLKSVT